MFDYKIIIFDTNFYLQRCSCPEGNHWDLLKSHFILNIHKIYSLSDAARKLYVRLFQRKYNWILRQRIKYPEIGEELGDVLQELENSGLTVTGTVK